MPGSQVEQFGCANGACFETMGTDRCGAHISCSGVAMTEKILAPSSRLLRYYNKVKRRLFRPPLTLAKSKRIYSILPAFTASKSAFAASSSWPLIRVLYCAVIVAACFLNLSSELAILRSSTLKPDLKTAARAPSLPYSFATLAQSGPTTSFPTAWQALHALVEKSPAVADIAINPAATTKSVNDFFTLHSSLYKSKSKKMGN